MKRSSADIDTVMGNDQHDRDHEGNSSSCLAQFVSNQEPGGVGESVTSNLAQAHPFGVVVISFTAVLKSPCFEGGEK